MMIRLAGYVLRVGPSYYPTGSFDPLSSSGEVSTDQSINQSTELMLNQSLTTLCFQGFGSSFVCLFAFDIFLFRLISPFFFLFGLLL
jgi:hypothetical protein